MVLTQARRGPGAKTPPQTNDPTQRGQFGSFCPTDAWNPAINIYRLRGHLEVCIDLAGADPRRVELTLRGDVLVIRGERPSPEPRYRDGELVRIESMEIDSGRFSREVKLPVPARDHDIQRHYHDGLLWVRLVLGR